MKRSTTPANLQKTSVVRSSAQLKAANQLKLTNKDVKKTVYSRMHHQNQSIAVQQQKIVEKPSTPSQINSLNNSCSKKLSTFQKYRGNNPEIEGLSPKIETKEDNLTSYLISKSWENSCLILSSQVNESMKKLVIEWLIELSHYMKLKRETLYHAMWIFERCLQKITDLSAKNLQLLAITCLFISAKYEEIYPPHLIALIQKTMNSYHKKQVIELQQKILIALNFELTAPNRYTFLNLATNNSQYLEEYDKTSNRLNPQSHNQKRYYDFLKYIMELTLLKSWPYSQKQIADSVIYMANKVMKRHETIIDEENLLYLMKVQQIAYEVVELWKQNKNSIVSFLFDSDQWSFVGGLTILF